MLGYGPIGGNPRQDGKKGGGDKGTKGIEERKKVKNKLRNLEESDEPWRRWQAVCRPTSVTG